MTLTDRLTEYVHAAFTGLWVQTHEADEAEMVAPKRQPRCALESAGGVFEMNAEGGGSARRRVRHRDLKSPCFPLPLPHGR